MPDNIILLGAYGYTASMVAEKLAAQNIFPVLAGRNYDKLCLLKDKISGKSIILQIDITNDAEINKLAAFDIIINCIGPYNLFSKNALDYAIKHGKTYMDICGEQAFIYDSFLREKEINNSGSCIVHSLAFESALADLLATEILDKNEEYTEIASFYYFENAAYSRGSRFSMQAMKHFPVWVYMENEFKSTQSYAHAHALPKCMNGDYAVLFIPYPELIFFARNYKTESAATWYIMDKDDAAFSIPNASQPAKNIEKILKKYASQNGGPAPEEMAKQYFKVIIESKTKAGKSKCIAAEGTDTYDLTAEILAKAVICLVEMNTIPKGLLSPSEFLQGQNTLAYLQSNGFIRLSQYQDVK